MCYKGATIFEGGYVEKTMNDDKTLEDCTVKELRERAKEIGTISGYSSMKKEELIAAIQSAEPAAEGEVEATGKPDETAGAEPVTETPTAAEAVKAQPAKKKASPKKTEKADAKAVTVRDVKNRIESLKKQKEDEAASGGKKERDRIRKRINRLKKQTRKIARKTTE